MSIAAPGELRRLVGVVEQKLAGLPPIGAGDTQGAWTAYKRAVDTALAELRTEGARVNTKWDGCSLRLGGISTTCTAGGAGAMRNWVAAARRKLGEGEGRAA